jgi:cysteine desulfuration protein SufE
MDEKLEKYITNLSLFDDVLDKYEYIIDLGKQAKGLTQSQKSIQNKIQGCQSSVWIFAYSEGKKLFFETDSDTVIVAGLAFMLADIFSSRTPDEILAFKNKELERLGLEEIISPVRLNGFSSMLERIHAYAKEAKDG